MAYVVVYTEHGEQVWASPALAITLRRADCPGNSVGSKLVRELREAVAEAEAMEEQREGWC